MTSTLTEYLKKLLTKNLNIHKRDEAEKENEKETREKQNTPLFSSHYI